MDLSQSGGPHIPEEWSRENIKVASSRNTNAKKSTNATSSVNAGLVEAPAGSLLATSTDTSQARKRKRADSNSNVPSSVPDAVPSTDAVVHGDGSSASKHTACHSSADLDEEMEVEALQETGADRHASSSAIQMHSSHAPATHAGPEESSRSMSAKPAIPGLLPGKLENSATVHSATPKTPVIPARLPPQTKHVEETESVMRGLFHQVEKMARRPGCALEEGIYLDSIMTHIPYIDVLQQMFGGSNVNDSACVPVVTRAYEESYMREVLGGVDEPCIMGRNCECQFVDEHNPFIGVQFSLPLEAFSAQAVEAGMVKELSLNKLCVLCCRKNTQSLFYEALYNHRAYNGCIQLYGNICDRPGEYAKEAMLICPLSGPISNMPLPIVAHQRNRYSVVVHNGLRQLRQHRVGYEDFHAPSSSRC
jgi:hypothetical protein